MITEVERSHKIIKEEQEAHVKKTWERYDAWWKDFTVHLSLAKEEKEANTLDFWTKLVTYFAQARIREFQIQRLGVISVFVAEEGGYTFCAEGKKARKYMLFCRDGFEIKVIAYFYPFLQWLDEEKSMLRNKGPSMFYHNGERIRLPPRMEEERDE